MPTRSRVRAKREISPVLAMGSGARTKVSHTRSMGKLAWPALVFGNTIRTVPTVSPVFVLRTRT